MAPATDRLSAPGAATYGSSTMSVGDGTWDFGKNSFLLPNLQGLNFETMQYNGMANRFSTLDQYHRIVLAHAVMGAIIFVFLVPMSIMLARFYASQPGYAVKYHAQVHVLAGLMLLAVFILGYFAVGPQRSLSNPHHGIGVAIFVLFILQLIGGRLVRRITKLRSFRIMIHQWFGRAIALLGIVQVPLGLTLYGSPKYLFVLYALWMAFLLLVYFFLSWRLEGRRELYMGGARSEAGHTRITESEYFSNVGTEPRKSGGFKWLGPLAAGAGTWALLRGRSKDRHRPRSPGRDRSRSISRSRMTAVTPSRRGSATYLTEKYSDVTPERGGGGGGGGGGFAKVLGGVAAAFGAGKLASGFMGRRRERRDEEYSAISTETPRRHRSGRGAANMTELSSEITDDYTRDPREATQTTLLPPSANPAGMRGGRSAVHSDDARRPPTPRQTHGQGPLGTELGDSDYSSYVSPSRRPVEEKSGGGIAKGILSGLGVGWIAKKMADRRARKEEERIQDEADMRSGTQASRFTGDGYPSPTRRGSRRPPPARRSTGYGRDTEISELTGSSMDSRPTGGHEDGGRAAQQRRSNGGPLVMPVTPVPVAGEGGSRPVEPVAMPAMPPDPQGVLHPRAGGSLMSSGDDSRRATRASSRRRRPGERAEEAARTEATAPSEPPTWYGDERERYGSPHSQPVSVKLKVHDDRDRNVTLRRLTEEEAVAARRQRGQESESSISGLESPSYGRRYRRDSSQSRMERAAERAAERRAGGGSDRLGPLSPPHPAFAKGGRRPTDSGTGGPSSAAPAGGHADSSLGSPESHGTWSGMSTSPGGPDRGTGAESAAAAEDRRRRRRQERRAASSTTRPSGMDMFD